MEEKVSGAGKSSIGDKIFLDTNILLYAHDLDAGEKYHRAKQVLSEMIEGIRIQNPFLLMS